MRYRWSGAAILLALMMLAPSIVWGQGATGLSISSYQFIDESRLSRTQWYVTYKATLTNTGAARNSVIATVQSLVPTTQVVAGQNTLHFSPVPANSQVLSSDTFTILVDRSVAFDFANLRWSFLNPQANPGPNQTAPIGSTITLNGGGSTNPSGVGTLTYLWAFVSKPAGSTATLTTPTNVISSFVLDRGGSYVVSLTVNNGTASDTKNVTISSTNSPPVANAGPNQTVSVGANVQLNGGGSSDVDGDALSYLWSLVSRPAGSNAFIGAYRSVGAYIDIDVAGTYIVQLMVNDGKVDSLPSTMTITTGPSGNTPPVARAGSNQIVGTGVTVQLNGSQSTDADGDSLTFKWSLITRPAGSSAVLNNLNVVNPTFVADLAGTYIAQLVVNDGKIDSAASTVTITTNAAQAPTANAGLGQTVVHGTTVNLTGGGTDPQNLPLTFAWSLTTRPVGSNAVLSSLNVQNPTFVADRPGTYIAQLIVNNGFLSSQPSTVTITTTNTVPVANPGSNKAGTVGVLVSLSGSGSFDADNDPLTYAWSFTTRPVGSTASLSAASSVTPTFVPDLPGTYIVQLIVNDGFAPSAPATVTITVTSSTLTMTLTPNPLAVTAGQNQNLTLNLSGPAPAGFTFNVSSNNPGVASVSSAPFSITAGNSTATIPVTGVAAGATSIRATSPGLVDATANVTVSAALDFLMPTTMTVAPGESVQFPITLARPAQSTILVELLNSDPSKAGLSTTSVTINPGQIQPTRQPMLTGLALGSAIITTRSNGLNPANTQVTIGSSITITPANVVISGPGHDTTVTLMMSGPAQRTTSFTLSSNNPNVATVPPSVPISAGSQSISFKITGNAVGSAVIRASAEGFTDATANVTVENPGGITLSTPNTSLQLWQQAPVTITLSKPAPVNGVTVTLTGDTTMLSFAPASVFIPQGATVGTSTITGTKLGSPQINATAPNFTAAAPLTVQIGTVISWVNSTATIVGNGKQILLELRLHATVPGGNQFSLLDGIAVNLTSSNPNVATVDTVANFFWDGSTSPTIRIPVNSVGSGQTTIRASAINTPGVNAIVTVIGGLSITNTSLPPGTAGASYTPTTLTAVGGTSPYSWAATGLPPNLSLNPTSGLISGTPTTPGSSTVNVTVTDSTSPAATASATFTLIVNAGPPASIAVSSGSPQSTAISTAFANPLKAIVKDAGNNPVGGVTVTFTAPGSGASGAFGGSQTATAVTDASGIATSPVFTANSSVGTYAVAASIGALSTNFSLTNNAGNANTIAVSSGSPQSTAINTAFPSTLKAIVKDSGNNPLSGVTVTFTAPSTGASGTFTGGLLTVTANTDASGIATSPVFTANGTTGTYNVAAVAGALSVNFSLTNTSGDPASLAVSSGSPQSAAINTAFAAPLRAIVRDAGNNPVSGVTVTFTAPLSGPGGAFGGSLTTTAVTNASGIASTSPFTANSQVGTYNVIATAVSGTLTTNFTLTNRSGDPNSITVVTGSGQSATVNSVFATPFKVLLKDSNDNPVSDVIVTFTAPPAGASGSFTGGSQTSTATSDATGHATASAFTANGTAGNYNVTVTAGVLQTIVSLTNTSGTPASIAVSSGSPQSAGVSTAYATAFKAIVKDASNNPVSGVSVTFTAPGSGASGTFAGGSLTNTSITDASGIATSTQVFTANATAGPFTLVASAGALSTNFSLTNTAGSPASIAVSSGSPQSAAINNAFANPLKAIVKDAGNNPVAGVSVTFTAPGSGASGAFGGSQTATATTDASGIATAPAFTANSTAGSYAVAATAGALSTNFALTNTVGAAASIAVSSGSPQNTPINTAFANPLKAIVKDAGNNPVAGVSVTFTAPANGASGSFGGSLTNTVNTDASGVATSAVFTANAAVGSYNVAASAGALSTNFALTNNSGPAASISVSGGSPQSAAVNTAFASALKAIVKDAGNNPVAGVSVTFTAPANGASGSFGGSGTNTVTTDATGVATSATFTANGTAGSYNVTANAGALSTTFSLTNTAGASASLTVSSGSGQSAKINTAFTNPLRALLTDAGGNPVSGATITFTAPGGGASGSFPGGLTATAQTNAAGIAQSPIFTANSIVGGFAVTATNNGLTANFALANTAGDPASLAVSSGSGQSTFVNTAFAAPLKALVRDAGNNPVSGVSVTFTAPASGVGGSFGGSATSTAMTDASGIATSAIFTANGILGSYAVTASSAGLTPVGFTLTNLVGPPFSLTIVSGSGQSAAINTAFANPLQALVKDSGGNPIRGATVTFTPPGSGASGSFANGNTFLTDTSGIAVTSTFTANGVTGGPYNVVASVNGLSVNFALTNTLFGGGSGIITVGNLTIGKNLQTGLAISLNPPVPAGGANITITSSDETKALVGIAGAVGSKTLTASLSEGTALLSTTVQALVGAGNTATITVGIPGYQTATSTITFASAGFVLSGPSGVGGAFTAFQGTSTPLSVMAAQLDANGVFAQTQQVRGGLTVSVPVSSNVTTVGTVSASTVTITGGNDTGNVNFLASSVNTGSTNVTLGTAGIIFPAVPPNPAPPPDLTGFSTPSTGASLTATVQQTSLVPFTATIAQGLQKAVRVTLGAPAASAIQLTVTSNDTTKLKFSTTPNGVGQTSVNVTIPINQTSTPDFYAQAFANTGTVGYTVTGFGGTSGTVTLGSAGLVIESPGGFGASSFTAQLAAGAATITVHTGLLGGGGTVTETQAVAGGTTVPITVVSSNTGVGTIGTSPVNVNGGSVNGSTLLNLVAAGSTNVTASAANFQSAQVAATVVQGNLTIDSVDVGNGLQAQAVIFLPQAAGAGGTPVHIVSNSASVKLAKNPTDAGASFIDIVVPQNFSSATFYVYGAGSTGSGTYTATALGLNATGTASLFPAAIVAFPSSVSGSPGSNQFASIFTARLDAANNPIAPQALAGSQALTITINSNNTSAATIQGGASGTVTIQPGTNSTNLQIGLVNTGNATVSIVQPPGFVTPTSLGSIGVTVF